MAVLVEKTSVCTAFAVFSASLTAVFLEGEEASSLASVVNRKLKLDNVEFV